MVESWGNKDDDGSFPPLTPSEQSQTKPSHIPSYYSEPPTLQYQQQEHGKAYARELRRQTPRKGVKLRRRFRYRKELIVSVAIVTFFIFVGVAGNASKTPATLATSHSGAVAPVTKAPSASSEPAVPKPTVAAPAPVAPPPAPVATQLPAPVAPPLQAAPDPITVSPPSIPVVAAPAPISPQESARQNALKSAEEYLSFTSFSRGGLIKQLEFDKYSAADAAWAADNTGANWGEQARKTAVDYLSTSAFSRTGLIKQLEFDQYSAADATSAADSAGADWNKEAVKSAKSYLSTMAFSHSTLTQQLTFDGFTPTQAEYGVAQAGL